MPISHLLIALLVVAIWGCNFVFVKLGLEDLPPFFLCFLRFLLSSVPAIFFIKPPAISLKLAVSYAFIMFGLQFVLMFTGIHMGITPGLAALLMQSQVFFSIFLAVIFLNETINRWQILGALVSFIGIGLVANHLNSHLSLVGFFFILGSAIAWACGNLITKKMGRINMMALVVWGSFIACFPLLILSLCMEGKTLILSSLHQISWTSSLSIIYIAFGSTWIGYGAWNWLLSCYPIATITPFSLLVPIFAMISSALILKEPLESWKLIASFLVMIGLCINLIGSSFFARKPIELDMIAD